VLPGDRVECRGRPLFLPETVSAVYNKPIGMEVTLAEGSALSAVISGLPAGCVPVGRLDVETGGVLLFSNDGDLAFRLTHPRWLVEREYLLSLESSPDEGVLRALAKGVPIGEGEVCRPVRVGRSGPLGLVIVLTTGRYHEVRRMAAALGLGLAALERTRYGPVTLSGLGRARLRRLGGRVLDDLYSCVGLDRRSSCGR